MTEWEKRIVGEGGNSSITAVRCRASKILTLCIHTQQQAQVQHKRNEMLKNANVPYKKEK